MLIKLYRNILCIIIALMSVVACTSSRSISSLNNKSYFKESPSIVSYQTRYFLRFVYSDESFAFFMMCESKLKNDSLVFYLPVTTSSGDLRGKTQFQEIIKENEIDIINKKKVFWEEPDGSYVSMEVEIISDEEIELLPKETTEN